MPQPIRHGKKPGLITRTQCAAITQLANQGRGGGVNASAAREFQRAQCNFVETPCCWLMMLGSSEAAADEPCSVRRAHDQRVCAIGLHYVAVNTKCAANYLLSRSSGHSALSPRRYEFWCCKTMACLLTIAQ